MAHKTHLGVVIPAYNEEEALPETLRALKGEVARLEDEGVTLTRVVVGNNNSSDRTAEVAAEGGAEVSFCARRGYGGACLAALAALAADPPELVLFMDADGADDPRDIVALLGPLLRGEAELVIGSRVSKALPGALSPVQRFGNALSCTLLRWLFGARFSDLGPFRVASWTALCALEMSDLDFGWTVEMQARAARLGVRCAEVSVHYRPRRAGVSKVSRDLRGAVRAGVKILSTIGRERLRGGGRPAAPAALTPALLAAAGRRWLALHEEELREEALREWRAAGEEGDLPAWVCAEGIAARLFEGAWGARLHARLVALLSVGLPERPAPSFVEEQTPALAAALSGLKSALEETLEETLEGGRSSESGLEVALVSGLEEIGVSGALLLLGQRRTSASYLSALGAPPPQRELLGALEEPHREGQRLTVGGRAFTKHAARSDDPWWGVPTGGDDEKSERALEVTRRVLRTPAWWNTFHHYKQGAVFEAREPGGHGARWGEGGARLIGFLEPFDEERGGTRGRLVYTAID